MALAQPVHELGRVFGEVNRKLQTRLECLDPEVFIDRVLNLILPTLEATVQSQTTALGLSMPIAADTQREIGTKLRTIRATAVRLLELAQQHWLLNGRSPPAVSAAVILVALRTFRIPYDIETFAMNLKMNSK